MTHRKLAVLLTLSFVVPPAAAQGQTDLSKFPLSKAIPDNVFIAVSARTNPERKFLDDYWAEITQAFVESGVMTDAWDMISDMIPDESMDEVENTMDRFGEMCRKIEWSKLFDKEMVYCGRFNPANPTGFHEGMFIGRSSKEQSAKNYSGLKKLMAELVKFANEKAGESVMVVQESKQEGASVTSIVIPVAGFSINVANKDDVIFINFGGSTLLADALGLMSEKGTAKPLVKSARFKEAFDQLPPAQDSIVFWDVHGMMSAFRGLMESVGGMMNAQAAGDEANGTADEPNPMKIVTKILDDLSIIDYMADSEWTDGYRVYSESVTKLRSGAKSSPLYDIITSGKPMPDFARFIPKEAESFSVSSGINMTKLYRYILGFVEGNVPDGKSMIEEWDSVQQNQLGFNLEKDVLALFEGSTVNFAMGKDWAILAKVTDAKKMDKQLERLFGFINGLLGKDNALAISMVKVADKTEFRQISHPMMMMMGGFSPPVIGCAEDHVVFGSSAKVVRVALNTAAGKHDNITKKKRWQEEALVPAGSVVSISYTDESNMAQDLQAAIGGISMGMGMMGMFMGDAPPEFRKIMGSVPPMLAKLAPVAGRLDFFKSNASYESFDGSKWISRSVQNYKKPNERPSKQLEAGSEGESEDGDADNGAE